MPIYEYRCECDARFERLTQRAESPAPSCPRCGGTTVKVPSVAAIVGRADPGLSREQMPQTWRGTHRGDRDYLTKLHRDWERRQRLEDRHPELAADTRPVLAHEGRYHHQPLRAGDELPSTQDQGHQHEHGSGSGANPGTAGSD